MQCSCKSSKKVELAVRTDVGGIVGILFHRLEYIYRIDGNGCRAMNFDSKVLIENTEPSYTSVQEIRGKVFREDARKVSTSALGLPPTRHLAGFPSAIAGDL
jgi:hypothetical protein